MLGPKTCVIWMCLLVTGACGGSGVTAQSLPFTESFSGDCQWPSGSNEGQFSYGCANGRYEMKLENREGSGDHAYHVTQDFGFGTKSVRAEIDASVVSGLGTTKGALLGIGCLKDDHHGYVAAVGTYGVWGIARLEKDFTWLTGTTTRSSTISATPIRIGIICAKAADGSATIAVLEDGKLVGSTTDQPRAGFDSYDGIFLYTNTYPGVVTYDDFVARIASANEIADARAKATEGEAG